MKALSEKHRIEHFGIKKPKARMENGTYRIKHWNLGIRVARRCPGKINSDSAASGLIHLAV